MNEDKLRTKYKVFETLLERKKSRFNELSRFQRDQVNSINEADMDQDSIMEDQTEAMLREARVENESLDNLKEEINYLEDYKSFGEKNEVGPSTLVKTSLLNLVVSVPQRTFEVGGEKYNGISTKSPVYEALEGKKAGEKVEFNGQKIEIKEVV